MLSSEVQKIYAAIKSSLRRAHPGWTELQLVRAAQAELDHRLAQESKRYANSGR